jgi:endoglucanase
MRLLVLIIFVIVTVPLHAQTLRVKGQAIVDEQGNEVQLRGMGLGGWMLQEPYMMQLSGVATTQHEIKQKIESLVGKRATTAFYQAWLQNHCTKTDIDSMAAWGFNAVRLPMHYNLFTLPAEQEPVPGKQTWLPQGFALTDSLLKWCAANKIYLILDLHAAPGGQGNDNAIADRDSSKPYLWTSEANKKKTIALWRQLAARYASENWIGGYDLINEPNYGFENSKDRNGCAENTNIPLKKLYTELTAAIREVDKNHIIFIEGNCWGNNYNGIFPLWDDQLVISFHKYWNYTNDASIKNFLDIRNKYNVPIWLGETGENSNAWFTDVVALAERNHIGWTMWPLKKAGINNPLQVEQNEGFKNIIEYWRGKGEKPSKRAARKSLMQLAEDVHASKNIYHKDVVDAMFRQVQTEQAIAFKPHHVSNKILFATDYDYGKSGSAYHDKDCGNYWVSTTKRTDWNKGKLYRNDGVDIQACTDTITNGYNVGWIEDGEWMQYTINNDIGGYFDVDIRYAAKDSAAQIQLLVNDEPVANSSLPVTHGDVNWHTTTIKNIRLNKGTNRVRMLASTGGFNLNYFQFNRTGGGTATY